jgi:hypothetical protein
MNTYSEKEYIKNEYIRTGLLDKNGEKIITSFDYPEDGGYIPLCAVCKQIYEENKDNENIQQIDSHHSKCGCLWWNYFKDKIKENNPNIVFEKKKNNSENVRYFSFLFTRRRFGKKVPQNSFIKYPKTIHS